MKNRITKTLSLVASVALSAAVAGFGHAEDTLPLIESGDDTASVSRDLEAEKIGLMPYQKSPVDVGEKERNPFASRAPEEQAVEETEENKEEDRIRLVLSELPIGGVSPGENGGLRVLLGDMKLERGAVVPQILPDQTAQLMVALITEEKIEFAWLEESGNGTGRRLVLPIDLEPSVVYILNGQQAKSEEEKARGVQYFPSHHRRDSGIISDDIGDLAPQFAPAPK